jgi:hypothetical protein
MVVADNGKKYKAVLAVWSDRAYVRECCKILIHLGHYPDYILYDGRQAFIYYN